MRLNISSIILLIATMQISMNCQQGVNRGRSVPDDLRIEALAGGLHPWEENRYIIVTAGGQGSFERTIPNKIGAPPEEEMAFTVKQAEIAKLWKTIDENNFFSLGPEHKNEEITGGWFASLTITASGKTHQVTVQNFELPAVANILRQLNKLMPAGKDLIIDGGAQ